MATRWHQPALDYISRWIGFQLRHTEQPGCVIAVASRGQILFEQAFGLANVGRKTRMTTRHRFRVASHSKSFTAAGVMRLRESGKLRLDDPVGRYVPELHPEVAGATILQLLSHSAGLIRDGRDSGQWVDRRPFLNREELLADLSGGPTIAGNTRFKYSNHGYGLVGMVIEQVVGESYVNWIQREVVAAAGLTHTTPDMPTTPGGRTTPNPRTTVRPGRSTPMASGHTRKLSDGHRLVVPGDNPTHALAPATGFVSTAGDLARFYAQLAPEAKRSFLAVASRREMVRRHWTDSHSSQPRDYGLGIISGKTGDWSWFGHSGGFQGFITRTAMVPEQELSVSVLSNAADGPAHTWLEGALQILQTFSKQGVPTRKVSGWGGRWASLWGTIDLLPAGNRVLATSPAQGNPMEDASEIEVLGRDRGRIVSDGGFGSYGEDVRQIRSVKGTVTDVWFSGIRMTSVKKLDRELHKRYQRR